MAYQLVQRDGFDFLQSLPMRSVHLIATDPPYASLEKHRARGTTTRLQTWFPTVPNTKFPRFFELCHHVLVDDAHLYVVCDYETAWEIIPMGKAAGFTLHKPIIWDKVKIGMGYHYRSRYEMVLFFEKGKRQVADLGQPDVIVAQRVEGGYPTQKPTKLFSVLVRQSASPGQVVVDPFMGSGTTALAAALNGAHFVGADISADALAITKQRLDKNGSVCKLIFPGIDPDATVDCSDPHERECHE